MLRQPPLSDLTSARYLHQALKAKGIVVAEGVVKQWMLKYRTGDTAATDSGSIKSTKELHENHGAYLQALPPEKKTEYLLCKTLRERDKLFVFLRGGGKIRSPLSYLDKA